MALGGAKHASRRRTPWLVLGLLLPALLLQACEEDKSKSQAKTAAPTKVGVAEARQETVPLMREFVGNTEAVKTVDVRSKVQGYLAERKFTEGSLVKEGDVLFIVDQRPFEADLAKSKAELAQNQASLNFALKEVKRYEPLFKTGDVAQKKMQEIQEQANAAKAAVDASKAAVTSAELDLEYSSIVAPIDGRIGRAIIDIGNLVTVGNMVLTTIVQIAPIYVYFSPSEAQYLEIEKYRAQGPVEVTMSLADGSTFGEDGTLDFVDNVVDQSTGTIKLRAVFPNAQETQRPGEYAKIHVRLSERPNTIVIPAKAVSENEAGYFVLVVGADNKIETRSVTLGSTYKDQRVVESGLKQGEKVVVEGLQKVSSGETVAPYAIAAKAATADGSKAKDETKSEAPATQ